MKLDVLILRAIPYAYVLDPRLALWLVELEIRRLRRRKVER